MAAALRFELGAFFSMMSIRRIDAFPSIYGVADEALPGIDEMGPNPLTGTKPKARANAEALHTKKPPDCDTGLGRDKKPSDCNTGSGEG